MSRAASQLRVLLNKACQLEWLVLEHSIYQRLNTLSQKLVYYGLPYLSVREQMLRRLSSYTDPAALQVLASVVQPPRDYDREGLKFYDVFSPLNRLVVQYIITSPLRVAVNKIVIRPTDQA